jgi:hypothetical protein
MGTGDYFPGVKRPGPDLATHHLFDAEVKNEWSYISSHLTAFMANTGTPLLFPFKVAVVELMYYTDIQNFTFCD